MVDTSKRFPLRIHGNEVYDVTGKIVLYLSIEKDDRAIVIRMIKIANHFHQPIKNMAVCLLGSSSSFEGVKKLIKSYYIATEIKLEPADGHKDYWDVYNSKGLVKGVRVVKKKNRFRFEAAL